MRVVLQRVSRACVRVDGSTIGEIGAGMLIFVGFTHGDSAREVGWMTAKVLGMRIFADEAGKMNRSIADVSGSVLVVSQFTLYGDARKGRRPSFIEAARPEVATDLYEIFIAALRGTGIVVETGEFGADMQVDLVNDGPVTLVLDSPARTDLRDAAGNSGSSNSTIE
jgi:D-aminoacyl-tRNA deacylase